MPTPTSYDDAWQLKMYFDYNSVEVEGKFGKSLSWQESYYLAGPTPYGTTSITPPIAQARKVILARLPLLAKNCKLHRNTLSLLSGYRDRWPVGQLPAPGFLTSGDLQDEDGGYCGDVDTALLFRFENTGKRFSHAIRGIRDAWTNDEYPSVVPFNESYGPYNTTLQTGFTFDYDALQTELAPATGTAVAGKITFGGTGTALGSATITTAGSGLKFMGSGDITFPGYVVPGAGGGLVGAKEPATVQIALVAGAIDAVTVDQAQGASTTYPAATVLNILPDFDGIGLEKYLLDGIYVRNFGATIARNCIFFSTGRVPREEISSTIVRDKWPLGANIPVADKTDPKTIVDNGNAAMRYMIVRTANRQTGRMYKDTKGRRKIAR